MEKHLFYLPADTHTQVILYCLLDSYTLFGDLGSVLGVLSPSWLVGDTDTGCISDFIEDTSFCLIEVIGLPAMF